MVLSQTKIFCKNCGKEVKIQDIIQKGDRMMCINCYRNGVKEPVKTVPKTEHVKNSDKEYKNFVCEECGYKFRFDINSSINLRCPYCGKENVVDEEIKKSDKLIEESEGYDW